MSGSYQATPANDVVAVFDGQYNQLFKEARSVKASVREKAKLMKHPVESGATVSDFRVIEQVQITLHVVLLSANYVDTYNAIKAVFVGDNTVNVQTNTGLYQNFMLEEIPHEEDPSIFDTIKMTLTCVEVLIASPSKTSALPASAVTKHGGNVTGQNASQAQEKVTTEKVQKSSAAYSLFFGK